MAKRAKKKRLQRAAPPGPARSGVPPGAPPEAELRRGLTAFQRGDYGEAVQAWKQARRAGVRAGLDRALAEAHFRRVLAAYPEGRRAQELQEAVALAPDCALYQFHLGLVHHRLGQLHRAVAAYEAAHRLAPAHDRARRHLALALLADPMDAPRARELLAGAPARDEATQRLRALALLRQGQPAEAVPALTAVKRPSPLAALALGLAQLAAGQAEAAAETLAGVCRSRRSLSAEARRAAGIAAVVARTRAGDLSGALKALLALEAPGEAVLRRALAAAARPLALELLLEERTEEALLAWQRALEAAPEHEPTRLVLAHLSDVLGTRAARAGDLAAAAWHWEAALVERPDDGRILRNLALAEERLERWQQAGARWEELAQLWKKELRNARGSEAAVELRRRQAVAYRHLAATYEAADDLQAATRTFERALTLDPSQVDLRLRAAELYLEGEEHGRAIDHLRRVLAERPRDTRVLADLGSAYDLKGDDHQAQAYLDQALALEPENQAVKATLAGVHHGRGHRLIRSGRAERAVAEYGRAIELEPGIAEHHKCLGGAYLKLGQLAPARTALERAAALDEKDPRNLAEIGGVYLEHGHEKEAEQLFRRAMRVRRGPLTQISIGLICLRLGHLAKAHHHFEPILRTRDSLWPALLGKLLIDAERETEAIRYLERAVALSPSDARARLDLAWALTMGRSDYGRAEAELAEAERVATFTDDRGALAEIADARRMLSALAGAATSSGRSRLLGGVW